MTYFSFQVFNDIICNYQRPPRIENNRVSRQLSSLEAESKKIYIYIYHYHQRYQKINEQKQRYLHLLNKSVSSESQNINKGRGKTLALALKKNFAEVSRTAPLYNSFYIKIVYHTCQKTKVKAEGHWRSLLLCNCLPDSRVIKKWVLQLKTWQKRSGNVDQHDLSSCKEGHQISLGNWKSAG